MFSWHPKKSITISFRRVSTLMSTPPLLKSSALDLPFCPVAPWRIVMASIKWLLGKSEGIDLTPCLKLLGKSIVIIFTKQWQACWPLSPGTVKDAAKSPHLCTNTNPKFLTYNHSPLLIIDLLISLHTGTNSNLHSSTTPL